MLKFVKVRGKNRRIKVIYPIQYITFTKNGFPSVLKRIFPQNNIFQLQISKSSYIFIKQDHQVFLVDFSSLSKIRVDENLCIYLLL